MFAALETVKNRAHDAEMTKEKKTLYGAHFFVISASKNYLFGFSICFSSTFSVAEEVGMESNIELIILRGGAGDLELPASGTFLAVTPPRQLKPPRPDPEGLGFVLWLEVSFLKSGRKKKR